MVGPDLNYTKLAQFSIFDFLEKTSKGEKKFNFLLDPSQEKAASIKSNRKVVILVP